ncbi:MAG: NINE protein [Akkermansia sp.]|nr:NINE protein [Akkermansia sp.]
MKQNTTQQQVIYVTQGKSGLAYILLGLFFGGFGFHDFYAGYSGKGFLKIVVSFIGVFLWIGGIMATAATVIASDMDGTVAQAPEAAAMPLMALLGIAMLGIQAFYILIQLFTVKCDSKGVPFS